MTDRSKRFYMSTALGLALASTLAAGAATASPILVTTGADAGPGSLRAALAEAAAVAPDATPPVIMITGDDITIDSTLSYAGTAPLRVIGADQVIRATRNVTVLAITEGADLHLANVTLQGPGDFTIEARGDLVGPAGKGLFVDLRDDQEGVVSLTLNQVTVRGSAGHGIHVSDCTLADDCGGGEGGAGDGSNASIAMVLNEVQVVQTAFGRFDADGVRVDERGPGDIVFSATASSFAEVGADGVELDEGQDGSVRVHVEGSAFLDNGNYCDPIVLSQFMPQPSEAEFTPGVMMPDALPGPVTGSPDDGCFEREVDLHDDGSVAEYAFGLDLDDGFDIDEAGPGDIIAILSQSFVNGNLDEGIDFDEAGAGDIRAQFIDVRAESNRDDGFKLSEAGDGDVIGLTSGSVAAGNGGVGVVFEEEDAGDVDVTVIDTRTRDNDGGDAGLEVVQDDDGAGRLRLIASDISDGTETEGVEATTE